VSGSSAPGAEKDITLINVITLHHIFSNLFFFDRVLKDIDLFEGTIFQGYIKPVKNGSMVGAVFGIDFFGFFADYFAD